ncbi:MAG: LysM peptidoglycan-binding domain-containing protein, partial [Melioribacteraceae bacterium]
MSSTIFNKTNLIGVKNVLSVKYYKIRNGDNLSRIAARNGTSVRALCRLNGISPKKVLRVGQR